MQCLTWVPVEQEPAQELDIRPTAAFHVHAEKHPQVQVPCIFKSTSATTAQQLHFSTLGGVALPKQVFPRSSAPRAWLEEMNKSLPPTPGWHRSLPTNLCTNPATPDAALSPTVYTKCFKGLINQPASFVTCVQGSLAPLGTPAEWAFKGKGYYHHDILERAKTLPKIAFQSRGMSGLYGPPREPPGVIAKVFTCSEALCSIACHQGSLSLSGKVRAMRGVKCDAETSGRLLAKLSRGVVTQKAHTDPLPPPCAGFRP